jgi:hypothetical protein
MQAPPLAVPTQPLVLPVAAKGSLVHGFAKAPLNQDIEMA